MLVWTRPATVAPVPGSYTPLHLIDKILVARSVLEGEHKQVNLLFADVVGFSTLATHRAPEDIYALMDGCFALLAEHVHSHEGTMNQCIGNGAAGTYWAA